MIENRQEIAAALPAGESIRACVAADGVQATKHAMSAPDPWIAITDKRLVVLGRRGAFRKRYEVVQGWPLPMFENRLNKNEGSALGSFMYCVALFTREGEAVLIGFADAAKRDCFIEMVHDHLHP